MATSVYDSTGRLRQRWDDAARVYTEWNELGVQTLTRAYTPAENAAADAAAVTETAATVEQALLDKARAALTANATFLALTSPTNAQTLAQVQRLTREVNALIKLQVRDLADTSGT